MTEVLMREVAASMSVRANTGDYQGTEFFVSMKAEVTELDDPTGVTLELQERVAAAMTAQLRRGYAARGKSLTDDQVRKQHGIPVPAP
jgi:hypothetical protein